jgi:chromosome partitioning protein
MAVSSIKGGVGKTTLSINLAFALAKRGWKTLLVDADPQGSVGLSLTQQAQGRAGLYEFSTSDRPLSEVVMKTRIPQFSILTVGQVPVEKISEWCRQMDQKDGWSRLWRDAEEQGYDVVLVDTPSGLHGTTHGVLLNVNYVVIPLLVEPLSVRSLQSHLTALARMREAGASLQVAGVISSMWSDAHEEARATLQDLRQALPSEMFLMTAVPRDQAFLKATVWGIPVGLMSHNPTPISTIFDQIAAELEPRLSLIPKKAEYEFIPLLD